MDIEKFTLAKHKGYKVVFDIVQKTYKALDPKGVVLAEEREDATDANRMWETAITHMTAKP